MRTSMALAFCALGLFAFAGCSSNSVSEGGRATDVPPDNSGADKNPLAKEKATGKSPRIPPPR